MEYGRTNLTEAVRSMQQLKIEGYSAATAMSDPEYIRSIWNVGGHEWEVHFFPKYGIQNQNWVALDLTLLSEPGRNNRLRASLSCRLVDKFPFPRRKNASRRLDPSPELSVSNEFCRRGECSDYVRLLQTDEVQSSGYLVNDSLTVQCTITVLKRLPDAVVIPANWEVPLQLPSSDMHQHLGELLQSQMGADVTFVLDSGERFPAHKNILAARSRVFKAEFFGHMNERSSQSVRIEDVQTAPFKAMLHFIYTDTAPELDEGPEAATTLAQQLLAAADRWGLDRLKITCEAKLSGGINVDTAATTLALADQHNCSLLKAKCVEFIIGSPERLDAVLATEGYKHLTASCPLALGELLKAARGKKDN